MSAAGWNQQSALLTEFEACPCSGKHLLSAQKTGSTDLGMHWGFVGDSEKAAIRCVETSNFANKR